MRCSEHGCEGGWVYVAAAYAQGQANMLTGSEPGSAVNELARRTHLNSVYPCRACNTRAFHRWREGHFNAQHDRASCAECQDVRSRRQPKSQPVEPSSGADVEQGSGYVERDRADL